MDSPRADLLLSVSDRSDSFAALGRGSAAASAPVLGTDARPLRAAWIEIVRTVLLSRTLDLIEETELLPRGKLRHQFSARGHELVQAVLAQHLRHPHDAAMGYYRSRPFFLGAGLTPREAFAGSLGLATGRSRGRDVGVVLNLPPRRGVTVLPTTGDVGGQYTPVAGWAQAIVYHTTELRDAAWAGAIAVAMGGDASVATGGFWSALTLATTLSLPVLFVIEDNGIGISTPSWLQTPGGDIARNLSGFQNLRTFEGSGSDPEVCGRLVAAAVEHVRRERRPALLRAKVSRLCGHSGLDAQSVPPDGAVDPLTELRTFTVRRELLTPDAWLQLEQAVTKEVRAALEEALADSAPDPRAIRTHLFSASVSPEKTEEQVLSDGENPGSAVTMKESVRLTLEQALHRNPRLILLGEDVGKKGGVHGMTAGLQARFGASRVVDTSLSEEGIIGRAVGMALAGLVPVPEIQFRKYLDAATEQINNCGTLRWRTAGAFAAPMVVRIPVGYHARVSDPWHSVSGEAVLAHTLGWKMAFPSNARDAAGLLRAALRGGDPTFFLEHRNLLVSGRAATPYPDPAYALGFGRARVVRPGTRVTVVTWGDMLYRVLDAAARLEPDAVEVIDLRTLVPWDRETVMQSACKTGRCLIAHEDGLTAGFGAEIAAAVGEDAFLHLEAPVARIAVPDCPIPYQRELLDAVLPGVDGIAARLTALLSY